MHFLGGTLFTVINKMGDLIVNIKTRFRIDQNEKIKGFLKFMSLTITVYNSNRKQE